MCICVYVCVCVFSSGSLGSWLARREGRSEESRRREKRSQEERREGKGRNKEGQGNSDMMMVTKTSSRRQMVKVCVYRGTEEGQTNEISDLLVTFLYLEQPERERDIAAATATTTAATRF